MSAIEVICWWEEAFTGSCPWAGAAKCFKNCDQFIQAVEVEFKEGDTVHYKPDYRLACELVGIVIGVNSTKKGFRYTIKDDTGETYDIYDYKGAITLCRI